MKIWNPVTFYVYFQTIHLEFLDRVPSVLDDFSTCVEILGEGFDEGIERFILGIEYNFPHLFLFI